MTRKMYTFAALDAHFAMSANSIALDYLIDSLILTIENDRRLYEQVKSTRIKAHSVVWAGMMQLSNECLDSENWPHAYTCSSDQIKAYFSSYGMDYRDALEAATKYVEALRAELFEHAA